MYEGIKCVKENVPENIINVPEYRKMKEMTIDGLIDKLRDDIFQLNVLEMGFGIRGYGAGKRIKSGFKKFYYDKKYNLNYMTKDLAQRIELDWEELGQRLKRGEHPDSSHRQTFELLDEQWHEPHSSDIRTVRQLARKGKKDSSPFFKYSLLYVSILAISAAGVNTCVDDRRGYVNASAIYNADPNAQISERWHNIKDYLSDARKNIDIDNYHTFYPTEAKADLSSALELVRDSDPVKNFPGTIQSIIKKLPDNGEAHGKFDDEVKTLDALANEAETIESSYNSKIPKEIKEAYDKAENSLASDIFIDFLFVACLLGAYSVYRFKRMMEND